MFKHSFCALAALSIALASVLMPFQKVVAQSVGSDGIPIIPSREIRVPMEDLPILLGGRNERMYMTRSEYEALLRKANVTPAQVKAAQLMQSDLSKIPTHFVMLDATHDISVQTGRAIIQSEIAIEVLKPGLHAVHLPLQHVGLLEATIDDKPAPLSPSTNADLPGVLLFLAEKGLFRLRLKMVTAVSASAAQQSLTIVLPQAISNKWRLQVPGNVEILSGAHVRSRFVDASSDSTQFDLIPVLSDGAKSTSPIAFVMTLNNKMLRDTRALEAKSFLLVAITQAEVQVTIRVIIDVLNGSENRFQIAIPNGFDVRSLTSPLISRWNIASKSAHEISGSRILEIELREAVADQVVIDIVASMPTKGDYTEVPVAWTFPAWKVLDATSQTAVLSLSLEAGLRMQSIKTGDLIPIDQAAFDKAIPKELRSREPTNAKMRAILSLYAPDANQEFAGEITKPNGSPRSSMNVLATVSDTGVRTLALVDFEAGSESVDNIDVTLPSMWRMQSAKLVDGQPLLFEVLDRESTKGATSSMTEPTRTRIRLPRPLAPASTTRIVLESVSVPKGWLADWNEQSISFPKIEISGTEAGPSVLSAALQGDFAVKVGKVENLIALFDSERIFVKAQGDGSGPSFSAQSTDWLLELLITRKAPQLTAEVFSFFQIETEGVKSAFELHLDVKQAAQDSFEFSLPESTPKEITIRGLAGVTVKESTSRVENGERIWSVVLVNRTLGLVKLQIEFSKSLETEVDLVLSAARVKKTVYQTGVIAIEGDDSLEVTVISHPRVADVGELTESSYSLGKRLLGVFEYSETGKADSVSVRAVRRQLLAVPTTIVEHAQLRSALSAHGACYHVAELRIRTTGGFVQAKLPVDAILWSVMIDGLPALPQKNNGQLLIELQAISGNSRPHDANFRMLRIVYQTPIPSVHMWTDVELISPVLLTMETATSASEAIPIADMNWQVWMPVDLNVAESQGDLVLTREYATKGFPHNIWEMLTVPVSALQSQTGELATRNMTRSSLDSAPMANSSSLIPTPPERLGNQPMMEDALDPFSTADSKEARPQKPSSSAAFSQSPSTEGISDRQMVATSPQAAPSASARANVETLNRGALEGLRTLPIEFEGPSTWRSFNLTGFGNSPSIHLLVSNHARFRWIALALAAFTVALGISKMSSNLFQFIRWASVIIAIAIGGSLASPWPTEAGTILSGPFYAAIGLLAIRILLAFFRRVRVSFQLVTTRGASKLLLLSLCFSLGPCGLVQAKQGGYEREVQSLEALVAALKTQVKNVGGPIEIPADAILVPYQPNISASKASEEKILIPYATYNKLLSLADPTSSRQKPSEPPVDYSVSGLVAFAKLDRDDAISLSFRIDITPHVERSILVPFALEGAVLMTAQLDGEPAAVSSGGGGLALVVQGQRTHRFEGQLQIPIQRQGGWRIINAKLLSAPSGTMTLTVPTTNTEVRLIGLPDAETRETTRSDEAIETSISPDGKLSIQWRPKVFENLADQGLSSQSDCIIAVEEQGLHLHWDVKLEFRRGRRDLFEFELPKDLGVEHVTGKNIRGWTVDYQNEKQIVKVTLLKSSVESERMSISVSRSNRLGIDKESIAVAPKLLVPEAMVQRGSVTIFRSELLDVEIAESSGLMREDVSKEAPFFPTSSPVPLKIFQAYRYASMEYQLSLKVRDIANKQASQSNLVLRVSRNDASLLASVRILVGSRPMFRFKLEVPSDWQWDSPQLLVQAEWTLSAPKDGARTLDILFQDGQTGSVVIGLSATQKRTGDLPGGEYSVDLPRIRVLDAASEKGELQVHADAGVTVRPEQLEGCEVVGNRALQIGPQQSPLSTPPNSGLPRATIRLESGNYKGKLRFQTREPQVTAMSISNMKITRRSLEETVYLQWDIKEAGLHRFEFILPAQMRDAIILGQMIRNEVRSPLSEQEDAPWKFELELQEDIIGQYRVLLQKDSPLPSGVHRVPIPIISTGLVEQRFVTLENSGRDEVLIESLKGVTQLARGDSQWIKLKSLLGGDSAEVYRVAEQTSISNSSEILAANEPVMSIKAQSRSLVETTTARIGLAQCVIAVDEAGNYRATQEFRVENSSEPYIELELPSGAELWTAIVAGTPVKPIQSSKKPNRLGASRLRLPLVRTQTGDLDYGVEVKYAGKLDKRGLTSKLDFPLIQSVNINVELSQVKLLLPEDQYWYGFSGTLGQVHDESSFLAGWLLHKNKQIGRLSQLSAQGDELFSKVRAEENIKQIESAVKWQLGNSKFAINLNPELQEQVLQNDREVNSAKAASARSSAESEAMRGSVRDNRDSLNSLLGSQLNYRAQGNVQQNTNITSLNNAATASKVPPPSQSVISGLDAGQGSKNSKGLVDRYRSKLQQTNQLQTVPATENDSGMTGGMGGGMGGGGYAAGQAGESRGLPGSDGMSAGGSGMGQASVVRNDFGVSPSFGPPGNAMQTANNAPSPTNWGNQEGTSLVQEFGTNLSLSRATGNSVDEAYMSSLAITLPSRGKEFFFTTPRGGAELSANGVSKSISRSIIGGLLLVLAVIFASRGWANKKIHVPSADEPLANDAV